MREKLYTIVGNVVSMIIVFVLGMLVILVFEKIGIIPRMQTETPPPTEPTRFPSITG